MTEEQATPGADGQAASTEGEAPPMPGPQERAQGAFKNIYAACMRLRDLNLNDARVLDASLNEVGMYLGFEPVKK